MSYGLANWTSGSCPGSHCGMLLSTCFPTWRLFTSFTSRFTGHNETPSCVLFSPGMGLFVGTADMFRGKVGVYLGCGDISMSEQFLNGSQVTTPI